MFADIPGYEGVYQVSQDGRVRSLKQGKVHVLKPGLNGAGYLQFHSSMGVGARKNVPIHRSVAQTFIPNEMDKPEVNHIDGNKLNNSVDNLEWATRSENCRHSIRVLGNPPPPTMTGKFGSDHNRSIAVKLRGPGGDIVEFGSGLEAKRGGGFDPASLSYARKQGLPYTFSRGALKGWSLLP